ncbi:hypothetical protein, partial [Escherichia coli]|uniref:hypothetical protein n=1 Tax=Escherichia coli TaxID=562 RepID=UPI00278C1471
MKANGVVFRLAPNPPLTTPAATLETLYMFNGQADGSLPNGSLIGDGAGGLLGTAALDGAHGGGVVFRLAPSAAADSPWIETPLWSFGGA